jgi:hypothetical protein
MEGMSQPLLLSESQQTGKHIENGRSWLFRDAKPCNLAEGYQQGVPYTKLQGVYTVSTFTAMKSSYQEYELFLAKLNSPR